MLPASIRKSNQIGYGRGHMPFTWESKWQSTTSTKWRRRVAHACGALRSASRSGSTTLKSSR
jgi:hypothetical protein